MVREGTKIALLGLITLVSAGLLRALPLFEFTAWGFDFGIHAGITEEFIESGKLYPEYGGWGSSYQYFPLLYWVTGCVAMLTGLILTGFVGYHTAHHVAPHAARVWLPSSFPAKQRRQGTGHLTALQILILWIISTSGALAATDVLISSQVIRYQWMSVQKGSHRVRELQECSMGIV